MQPLFQIINPKLVGKEILMWGILTKKVSAHKRYPRIGSIPTLEDKKKRRVKEEIRPFWDWMKDHVPDEERRKKVYLKALHEGLDALKVKSLPQPPKDWDKRFDVPFKEWGKEWKDYWKLQKGYILDYEDGVLRSAPGIPTDEWGFEAKQTWLLPDEFEQTTQGLKKLPVGKDGEEVWGVVRTVKRFKAIDIYQPPKLDPSWGSLQGLLNEGKISFLEFTKLQKFFVKEHNEEGQRKKDIETYEVPLESVEKYTDDEEYNLPSESDEVQNWSYSWRPMFLSKEEFYWDGMDWIPLTEEYSTYGKRISLLTNNPIMEFINAAYQAVEMNREDLRKLPQINRHLLLEMIDVCCATSEQQAQAWKHFNNAMDDIRKSVGQSWPYWTLSKQQKAAVIEREDKQAFEDAYKDW